jgi:hypothetical protein
LCLKVRVYLFEFNNVLFDVLAVCESKVSLFGVYFSMRRVSFSLEFRVQNLYCILDFDAVINEVLPASAGYRDAVHSLELLSLPSFEICLISFSEFIVSLSLSPRSIYSWSSSWVNWRI